MHQPFDDDFPMEEINLVDLYKEEVEFLKKQNEFLEKSKKAKDQRQRWRVEYIIMYYSVKHIKEQILMKTRTLH